MRDQTRKLRRRWWLTGTFGALAFGAGLCCTVEAGFLKHSGSSWQLWVLAGTASLALVISGLVLLIRAGIQGEALKKKK
ncbi:hypothetical protein [Poritiphilus flavus]|uniref:Uncharacterized protein n=1 Tax=Poritiphilus flavus TaxID=2697053 RepID=A0A6L9EEL4_9FLAO|nr:hypothetical protein [Poritiphilus flavus]NAS13185.1 hypothetical protein [Poritiphilus flavus]